MCPYDAALSGTDACVLSPCVDKKNLPVSIVYIPSHLYHMLFELFKVPQSYERWIYWSYTTLHIFVALV